MPADGLGLFNLGDVLFDAETRFELGVITSIENYRDVNGVFQQDWETDVRRAPQLPAFIPALHNLPSANQPAD